MKSTEQSDPVVESARAAAEPPAEGADTRRAVVQAELDRIATDLKQEFEQTRRVLSFGEYLELFSAHPVRHSRSAAHYVRDMFLHYGTEVVRRPWGSMTRYRLFDCPWEQDAVAGREPELVAHEELQGEIFRALSNFAREGRANRLVLMHGPNGSAKSTAAACILRALEAYSKLEQGALYRFHWIFPSRKTSRGSIGFGSSEPVADLDSFAHLDDDHIDARLVIELRDHPLFLLPGRARCRLVDSVWETAGAGGVPPEWLRSGDLSHKNRLIYEALLSSYGGDLKQVLRHVQVERYFVSRRYRVGAVTLGPEMSVDARERQISADRSVTALPTSLQATTLFEAYGELVEAAGGVLEFSDLLKRPLDAFRYLQLTLETGQVSLSQQNIFTNVVMIGSANDIHLAAFREHPEYQSFRGRIELVRVPYLRSYHDEERIYQQQIVPQLRRHVAPHTTRVAAEFAVLTRMRRPDPARYEKPLGKVVESLSAVEKMVLYADAEPPGRLSNDERKLLKAGIEKLYLEEGSDADYEGRIGVSPRTVRTLLLDAAQSARYQCVSPFAVLDGIEQLCKRTGEFEWLKLKPLPGGYHDPESFRQVVRTRLLDASESDLRAASGLVEAERYRELFGRYMLTVSAFVKGERLRNKVTGKDEVPDERMMREVESLLGVEGDVRKKREMFMSTVAAWAIDHPGAEPHHEEIFPGYVARLEKAAFERLRTPFALLLRGLVTLLRHGGVGMDPAPRRAAEQLRERLGPLCYDDASAADAASALLRDRYADIVV